MGEKQIEIDRRRARERIVRLHKRLEQIEKERQTQRKLRQNELKVAIVGYTNSGKTTLMKGLSKATIDGCDQLFATLDSNVRTMDPTMRPRILLSDTVGFIRNLPHSLIESFKSTLEEVVHADLLLHVVDISHPHYELQMHTTEEVLCEVGAEAIPMMIVFNKMDLITGEPFLPRILRKKYEHLCMLSSLNPTNILELRTLIFQYFEKNHRPDNI
jgi:GTP-binding protein HflX